MKDDEIKKAVREGYGRIATKGTSCCTPLTSCCGGAAQDLSKKIGYGNIPWLGNKRIRFDWIS